MVDFAHHWQRTHFDVPIALLKATEHYEGTTDFSIPDSLDKIQSEKEQLEDEDREPERCDFLTDILTILDNTNQVTIHDLRHLTPDEIYNITPVVISFRNSQHIDGSIQEIYQQARPAIKKSYWVLSYNL